MSATAEIDHLPRLALIADGFTDERIAERAVAAAEAGVRWIHLRDRAAAEARFAEAAHRLAGRLRAVEGRLLVSVNTRMAVAEDVRAEGLHLGRRGASLSEARERLGAPRLLGASVHTRAEAEAAVRAGADYFFFSPVFPTTSKPGHPGAGLGALAAVCAAFPQVPVWALGGITPERAAACLEAGARGVAVLSGILHADDPQAAAARYLATLARVERSG